MNKDKRKDDGIQIDIDINDPTEESSADIKSKAGEFAKAAGGLAGSLGKLAVKKGSELKEKIDDESLTEKTVTAVKSVSQKASKVAASASDAAKKTISKNIDKYGDTESISETTDQVKETYFAESDVKVSKKDLSTPKEKKQGKRAERKAEKQRKKEEEQKKNLKMGLLLMGIALLLCVGMYVIGGNKEEVVTEEPAVEESTDDTATDIAEDSTEEEPESTPEPAIGNDINTVGNKVAFGEYNGQKINWWVCETNEGKSLLVSADQVTEADFNDTTIAEATNWERSTLRGFLNDTFINEAFDETERQCVLETEITDDDVTTYDKVFILNEKQYREYYAITKVRFNGRCWLMDQVGDELYRLEEGDMGRSGELDYGLRVNETCGVRPAIWVDAELFKGISEVSE